MLIGRFCALDLTTLLTVEIERSVIDLVAIQIVTVAIVIFVDNMVLL
jgi:hypothetical protein